MAVQVTESVIIKGSEEDIFALWTDYEMFPSIIDDIKEVQKLSETTSRWVVKGPLGKDVSWTAEITRFDEDRRIGWKTLDGDIKTSGQVTFKDLPDNQTEVTVMLQYVPPAGKVGEVAAKVLADPREKITEGLRDIKAYAEGMPERIRKTHNKE
jgi:uncharacterized membrane protein